MSSPIISPKFAQFIDNRPDYGVFKSQNNIDFKNQVEACLDKLYEMYLKFKVDSLKETTIFVLNELPAALLLSLTPEAQPLYRNSIPRTNQYKKFSELMKKEPSLNQPGLSSIFHIQEGQSFKNNIFELTSAIEQIYEYVINGVNNGSAQKFLDLLNAEPPVACLNDAIAKLLEIATSPAITDNMDAVNDITEDICKMFKSYPPKSYEKRFEYWFPKYFLNPPIFGYGNLRRKYPEISERDFKLYITKYVSQYVTQNVDNFTIDCSMIGGGKKRRNLRATKKNYKSCRHYSRRK